VRLLFRLVIVLVVAAGILAGALFGLTRQFTVPGTAMAPTIEKGDHVAVFRFSDWFYTPHRKDVVVFTAPASAGRACGAGKKEVERVIGLPGETVSEQDGNVSIGGTPLAEPYVKPANRDTHTAAWHVPPGQYFVMGDNRKTPCDSRAFGSVPKKDIVGRVLLTFWPIDRVSID
jgi:signal peptidase I